MKAQISLIIAGSVIVIVYSVWVICKVFAYPLIILIRLKKSKDKKTEYWVYYDDKQLFGSAIYIAKPAHHYDHNISIWFSGTYKECRQFIIQDKKEEKQSSQYRQKMEKKNKNSEEFFYDTDFDDYDKPNTNSDINRGFLFRTSY